MVDHYALQGRHEVTFWRQGDDSAGFKSITNQYNQFQYLRRPTDKISRRSVVPKPSETVTWLLEAFQCGTASFPSQQKAESQIAFTRPSDVSFCGWLKFRLLRVQMIQHFFQVYSL